MKSINVGSPTYTGQIIPLFMSVMIIQDHPPLRRTNQFFPCTICVVQGSPPPYAGQILRFVSPVIKNGDHPRLRRTKKEHKRKKSNCSGSPPLTQDKCIDGRFIAGNMGITPAYAGQITSAISSICSFQDHPRLRRTNENKWPEF